MHFVKLPKVLFVPKLASDLVSAGQLVDDGYYIHFSTHGCVIHDQVTWKLTGKGHKVESLFVLDSFSPSSELSQFLFNIKLRYLTAMA